MCNTTCGTFCFLTSIFGVAFLSLLATLIKNDYKYVGEWFDKGEETDEEYLDPSRIYGLPTKDMKDNASKTLYLTAGIYAVFTALSLVCIGMGSRRK